MTIYQKEFLPLNSNIMAIQMSGFLLSDIAKQRINMLQSIKKHFNYDLARAGLKHIRVHDLRHSAVSYLFNHADLTIQQIASRIGDTVDVVLKTYAHFYHNNDEIVTNFIKASKANRKD